ncbi:MAG: hypothetical protein AAFW00_23320 [Bacteroidota bacterium]
MSFFKRLFQSSASSLPEKEALSFDTLGWPEIDRQKHRIIWQSEEVPAQLSLNFFPSAPDLPRPLSHTPKLIKFYRKKLTKAQGGILEVKPGEIQGFRAIDTLFKMPMEKGGFIYVSSITIPFVDCSYVVKLQAQEYIHIGKREQLVEERLEKDNKVPDQWTEDPYDSSVKLGSLRHVGDDVRFDLFFPDHPLSQLRGWMFRVKNSLHFDESFSKLEPLVD